MSIGALKFVHTVVTNGAHTRVGSPRLSRLHLHENTTYRIFPAANFSPPSLNFLGSGFEMAGLCYQNPAMAGSPRKFTKVLVVK